MAGVKLAAKSLPAERALTFAAAKRTVSELSNTLPNRVEMRLPTTKHFLLCVVIAAAYALSVSQIAAASQLSFGGYGAATWGMTPDEVSSAQQLTFDCSEGLVPGQCLCPPYTPSGNVVYVFGNEGTALNAVFSVNRRARTDRGIHPGSSKRSVKHKYPKARLVRKGALTSGLSTYYIANSGINALVFMLGKRHVSGIIAFENGNERESELCG